MKHHFIHLFAYIISILVPNYEAIVSGKNLKIRVKHCIQRQQLHTYFIMSVNSYKISFSTGSTKRGQTIPGFSGWKFRSCESIIAKDICWCQKRIFKVDISDVCWYCIFFPDNYWLYYTYAKFHLTKQITAYGDHTDVAKALLAYGADINALDSKGYSPLMVAGKKKVA